jgi:hypothetical protein
MKILWGSIALLFLLVLGGCVNTKAMTPLESQVVAQVIAHRLIVPNLDAAGLNRVRLGVQAARAALITTAPIAVLDKLDTFFSPEDADIAALVKVLIIERVDLTALPELEGREYVSAILLGIEGGLK